MESRASSDDGSTSRGRSLPAARAGVASGLAGRRNLRDADFLQKGEPFFLKGCEDGVRRSTAGAYLSDREDGLVLVSNEIDVVTSGSRDQFVTTVLVDTELAIRMDLRDIEGAGNVEQNFREREVISPLNHPKIDASGLEPRPKSVQRADHHAAAVFTPVMLLPLFRCHDKDGGAAALATSNRGGQCRVVIESKIASEPEDGSGRRRHPATPAVAVANRSAASIPLRIALSIEGSSSQSPAISTPAGVSGCPSTVRPARSAR